MRLEHYPVEKLKARILQVLRRHLDLGGYRVFFFGSRVSGNGDEHSDIDVGIEGPETVPSEAWALIQEEIENLPLLYKIDIVDFKRLDSETRSLMLQHCENIWEPSHKRNDPDKTGPSPQKAD